MPLDFITLAIVDGTTVWVAPCWGEPVPCLTAMILSDDTTFVWEICVEELAATWVAVSNGLCVRELVTGQACCGVS